MSNPHQVPPALLVLQQLDQLAENADGHATTFHGRAKGNAQLRVDCECGYECICDTGMLVTVYTCPEHGIIAILSNLDITGVFK